MSTRTPIRVFGSSLVSNPSYPFRPYVYGGDVPLSEDPEVASSLSDIRGRGLKCGTVQGYWRHVKARTATCQPCRDAVAERNRLARIAREGKPPSPAEFSPDKCGTRAGYARHKYHRLEPCTPCLDANAEYHRIRKEGK